MRVTITLDAGEQDARRVIEALRVLALVPVAEVQPELNPTPPPPLGIKPEPKPGRISITHDGECPACGAPIKYITKPGKCAACKAKAKFTTHYCVQCGDITTQELAFGRLKCQKCGRRIIPPPELHAK